MHKDIALHYISCSIAQLGHQQSDSYLSGSSLEWVPLLVLGNVWVAVVGVIWFVPIFPSSLCFSFTPTYDLSYAGIPDLEGLQQISDLIHPKLTAPPEAAFQTVVESLAYILQGNPGCVHLAVYASSPKELQVIAHM